MLALVRHRLLDARGIPGDQWVDWASGFRHVGHRISGAQGQSISYLIGVQMALDGKGRILGWHSFVGNLVAKGRLVRLLDAEIRSPGGFFLT